MSLGTSVEDTRLTWPRPLFAYQRTGVRALLERPALLLADEMGLGKTIQVIAALRCLFLTDPGGPALIVAPAGLVLQWRRELRLWAPELRLMTVVGTAAARAAMWRAQAQVFIAGYETVTADLAGSRREWAVVILDEAQRIKNPEIATSQVVKRLPRRRSWALTGTPLENRLDDLISILDFVAPGRLDRTRLSMGLRTFLGEVQLRRRRAEVLQDLPPKTTAERLLVLEPRQRAAYERAEREGLMRLEALGVEVRITHVLELILRLKQICNFCPESDASAKLADLALRLEQVVEGGGKALVFSQFVEEPFGVKRLARALARHRPLLLSGDQGAQERADVVAVFEQDPDARILLCSLKAGGVGLNLTAASFVFHFDRWWNPAVETQAEDRAHRIGQRRPVQVYAYLCADTVEERIAEIIREKRQLFADVVDGVSLHHIRRLGMADLMSAVSRRPG